jgi:hypothetical protein
MSTRMRLLDRRPCETFQLEVTNPDDRSTRPRGARTCPDQPIGVRPGSNRCLLTECQQALGRMIGGQS